MRTTHPIVAECVLRLEKAASMPCSKTIESQNWHIAVPIRRNASVCPPLYLWQTVDLKALDGINHKLLRRSIGGFAVLGEPAWPRAAQADASAAIACAVRAVRKCDDIGPRLHLTMTALLICAVNQDPTARLVFEHLQRVLHLRAKAAGGDATWFSRDRVSFSAVVHQGELS